MRKGKNEDASPTTDRACPTLGFSSPLLPHNCVFARIPSLPSQYSSFPGLVHGGILATLVDDIAYWSLFHCTRQLALTSSLQMKYSSPAKIGEELYGLGVVQTIPSARNDSDGAGKGKGREGRMVVRLYNKKGRMICEGQVVYTVAPTSMLRGVFGEGTMTQLQNAKL
tara:strand:+ start:1389 stop:1892 length:504 start_codon:yes stop_codon:yes gene_type:complete